MMTDNTGQNTYRRGIGRLIRRNDQCLGYGGDCGGGVGASGEVAQNSWSVGTEVNNPKCMHCGLIF
jgi:hypothetical protein